MVQSRCQRCTGLSFLSQHIRVQQRAAEVRVAELHERQLVVVLRERLALAAAGQRPHERAALPLRQVQRGPALSRAERAPHARVLRGGRVAYHSRPKLKVIPLGKKLTS